MQAEHTPLTTTSGELMFTVYGVPSPQGSKRGFVKQDKRSGRTFAAVVDVQDAQLRIWRGLIIEAARAEMLSIGWRVPIDSAFEVRLDFYFVRPRGHFGVKGNLLPSAPGEKITAPDLDKLTRGAWDALTHAGVIRDDACIVESRERKQFGERPGLAVRVRALTLRQRQEELL